jgi:hypothetical protein
VRFIYRGMSSTAGRRRSRGRGVESRSGKARLYRTAGGKAAERSSLDRLGLPTFHTFRAYNTVRSAPSRGAKLIHNLQPLPFRHHSPVVLKRVCDRGEEK